MNEHDKQALADIGRAFDSAVEICGKDMVVRFLAQPDVQDEQARDAERYRWLRHALSDNGPNGKSHWFCSISAGHPEELDSAIDAAMKGGEA